MDSPTNQTHCGLVTDGSYDFNASLVVKLSFPSAGPLDCVTVRRVDTDHPNAAAPLKTGHYWTINGLDSFGNPATGFNATMTLPVDQFVPTGQSRVCRYTGVGTEWDCGASAFNAQSITREGITHFSDWATAKTNLVNALALTRFTGTAAVPSTSLVTLAIPAIAAVAGWLIARQRRR